MKYLVTAEEMRRYDANTIEKIGIPAMVLMERAALAAFDAAERYLSGIAESSVTVLVLAGVGNNGGDGLALSRLMCEAGYQVQVWIVGDRKKASKQWKKQWEILGKYPVEVVTKPGKREYTVMIDALFGVGLSREVTGRYREAVELFGELSGYKIALDLPSGVDSDTGKLLGCAALCQETVTFGFCKRGLVFYPGCEYAGHVTVADIGLSSRSFFECPPEMFALEESFEQLLPVRDKSGNKGTFGKVLLVAGNHNMAGAAILSARAAYRSGAGMVKVITAEENRVILQETVPEALFGTYEELESSLDWADVIAIGPGIGKGKESYRCMKQVLSNSDKPVVIDADGLNLSAENPDLMKLIAGQGNAKRAIVLTPHVGELSRLTDRSVTELKEDLAAWGLSLARQLHAVVVAKDARTLICDGKNPICVNLSGNSGMATAGSGDVLTGIIAALLAQGEEAFRAACAGVRLHGLAGDRVSERIGEHACMAGDLIFQFNQTR